MFNLTPRYKIILSFLLPGIIAIWIVVGFLHFRLLNSAIERWGPDNRYLIYVLQEHLLGELKESEKVLVFASHMPAFSSLPFLQQINKSINGIPENADIEKRQILEELRRDMGDFSSLFVLSPEGDIYISHPYSVQKKLQLNNLSQRAYFIKARQTKSPVLSDKFLGADGSPVVVIDVPILNSKQEIIAHLGGTFHLNQLSKKIETKINFPFSAGAIIDRKGELIAKTNSTKFDALWWQRTLEQMMVNNLIVKGYSGLSKLVNRFTDSNDNTEYLVSSDFLSNGWFIIFMHDKESIIQTVQPQVVAVSTLVFFLLCGFVLLGILWVSRVSRKWELAEQQLYDSHNKLEQKVIARTVEVERSKSRYKSIVDSFGTIDQGLFIVDANYRVQFINGVMKDWFGDMVGSLCYEAAENRNSPCDHCRLSEVVNLGKTVQYHVQTPDKLLDIVATPLKNTDGSISKLEIIRDVSSVKKAEEQINKLSQVVEQSPVTVIITDIDGNIEYVNKEFELSTGYSSENVLGKNPRFLKSGETTDKEYKQLWQTISSGKVWNGIFHNLNKEGQHIWESASISSLKNTNDEITNYIAIKVNITQQKENEKQLRLAQTVFETASEGMMVTDVDNKIQMVNKAFCLITGYNNEDVIGKDPSLLNSGRHSKEFYQKMLNTLKTSSLWSGEIWNRRKNGVVYPEWLAISTMLDSKGELDGYVSLFSDISKRKMDEDHIQHQANYDPLTGLANRNLFSDRFSRALLSAESDKKRVALLFIDLDRFKNVNDTLGHLVGDLLLQEAAKRLTKTLRKSDTVARLGGDEFAVVLPDILGIEQIEEAVNKIISCLSLPYILGEYKAFISASVGITVFPDDGDNSEALIRNADSAMYKAKDKGRKGFHFYTLEMDIEAQRRRILENDLHNALKNNEFSVYYQPILCSETGEISSAEALIRWNNPEKGLISPADFIPLAEEVGLILPIGEWVLREACIQAASWSNIVDKPPSIAINLSSRQFQRQNIPDLVQRILSETGLLAQRLSLEITEGLLVIDNDRTMRQLQKIREMGAKLSIDDFGTGYSSLSYLKKFPISTLKIDRSFIMELPDNVEDAALVDGILSMAKSLNLNVVAEGVETRQQVEFLKSKKCQYLQGFLFSKPLPKNDFIKFLKSKS
ncbi:MAG: EAL domain-containing protein [Pseudomonadota bacterium]